MSINDEIRCEQRAIHLPRSLWDYDHAAALADLKAEQLEQAIDDALLDADIINELTGWATDAQAHELAEIGAKCTLEIKRGFTPESLAELFALTKARMEVYRAVLRKHPEIMGDQFDD